MATKLYPPIIEGTIPAFAGTELSVPFSLNRAVSKKEIAGIQLKLKTIQGSTVIDSLENNNTDYLTTMTARFSVPSEKLTIGQYYKVQLAFKNSFGVGIYSTVGVVKYTSMPEVSILNLNDQYTKNHIYTYTGNFKLKDDLSEKLYSSQFIIYKGDEEYAKSDVILHNINDDTELDVENDTWVYYKDLEEEAEYSITWIVETINGLVVSSPKYGIKKVEPSKVPFQVRVDAVNDFEDGIIDVSVALVASEATETFGNFVIMRSEDVQPRDWREIGSISLAKAELPSDEVLWSWKDFTTQQGVKYVYSWQQINDYGIYGARTESNVVEADFEDTFLYDGERQLKIRFNPKISSFKTDLQEQKLETIGSKYPFIFRNGNIYYKEFPIDGLVSYQMDNNEYFIPKEELALITVPEHRHSTSDKEDSGKMWNIHNNQTADNFASERIFKLKVLEWLNNGKVKLFRSPQEGNYIVRLLNNSLTPNDTVSRMLHSFKSTAYEVADFSFDALVSFGILVAENGDSNNTKGEDIELVNNGGKYFNNFISLFDLDENDKIEKIKTLLPSEIPPVEKTMIVNYNQEYNEWFEGNIIVPTESNKEAIENLARIIHDSDTATYWFVNGVISDCIIVSLTAEGLQPGTKLIIGDTDVYIGSSGYYHIEDIEKQGLSVIPPENHLVAYPQGLSGKIIYEYIPRESLSSTNIKNYTGIISIEKVPMEFYGSDVEDITVNRSLNVDEDLFKIDFKPEGSDTTTSEQGDTKNKHLRPFVRVFEDENNYYITSDYKGNPISKNNLNPMAIYAVCEPRPSNYLDETPVVGLFNYEAGDFGWFIVDKEGIPAYQKIKYVFIDGATGKTLGDNEIGINEKDREYVRGLATISYKEYEIENSNTSLSMLKGNIEGLAIAYQDSGKYTDFIDYLKGLNNYYSYLYNNLLKGNQNEGGNENAQSNA